MAARKPKAAAPAPTSAPAPPPPPPAFGAYSIEQLGFCQCKYPVRSVGERHFFCGQPTTIAPGNRHGSWCEEHRPIVFVPYQRGGVVVRKAEVA